MESRCVFRLMQKNRRAFVGQDGDVITAHAIRRIPIEERWQPDMLNNIRGVPCMMQPSQDDNAQMGTAIHVKPEGIISPVITEPEEMLKPLRCRLKPSDFEAHGYTGGCPGCRALLRRVRPQAHSEECRNRMELI